MIHNNILEQKKTVYLVFTHILKFTERRKESKIIVILIQRKDLDLEERMQKDLGYGYCTLTDETYDNGPIVLPYVKKLKISIIEIWAIHHPADEADDHAEVNIDLKDPLL
jgi:hypothetical protein